MKERLTRFRSFWIFPLLSIALLLSSHSGARWPLLELVGFSAMGLASWTLVEYFFHRFLLHAEFHNTALRAFLNGSHMDHHAAPRDRNLILVQPPFALVTSALIYVVVYLILRNAFQTAAVLTGVWVGFLYYETVHYRVHVSLANSALLQQQRRAHFYHHFSDSEKCFGVTSPFWDYVFGTMRRRARQV